MTDEKNRPEIDLEAFFDASRRQEPPVSEALLARIMGDAEAMLPVPARGGPQRRRFADRRGMWQRLMSALGGGPALAGLAAATVAGVWIGLSTPGGIGEEFDILLAGVSEDLYAGDFMPEVDFEAVDGGGEAL